MGVEILSTGGTLSALREAGIEARPVSEVIGFPEILDGRVKTLHPKIHGGLLGRPDLPEHVRQMQEHGIEPIDLVVVNLYPFERTVAKPGVGREEAIENIDIGGPSMLRSAAKNHAFKAVVVNPDRYGRDPRGDARERRRAFRRHLCLAGQEVFRTTSAYDAAIAEYLTGAGTLPPALHVHAAKDCDLRYGENPHQRAALYGGFSDLFVKLHGKELSFNNIVDIERGGAARCGVRRADGGHHQAHESLRRGVGSHPRRGVREGLRHGYRSRRSAGSLR